MTVARIVGAGSHLPGPAISNERLAELVGPLPDDVLEGLQVKARHWIADPVTGRHLESNSDMAAGAARAALASAHIEPQQVDLIVVSSSSPEYHLPPLATQVQDKLGIERCAVLDIRSGCAGAVDALNVARLRIESGERSTALVIGSEVISPLLVPMFKDQEPDSIRMRDRIPLYAFGDGAGALVLQAAPDGPGFLGFASACVGGGVKPGMSVIGGGTHAPIAEQLAAPRLVQLRLDVVESARRTPQVLVEALCSVLAAANIEAAELDVCIIPEGNAGYLLSQMKAEGAVSEDWLALRSRIVENLADVGATGSAAVPLALDQAWRSGSVRPGQKVMLLALETSKWIYSGMVVISWFAPRP